MTGKTTEAQLVQALRELGAVSSETAVTTRAVALHLELKTGYVRNRLDDTQWMQPSDSLWWRRRQDGPIGHRSNGGPNYWWAK